MVWKTYTVPFTGCSSPVGLWAWSSTGLNPGVFARESAELGYVPESYLIGLLEGMGFELVKKSETNANPKDTRDYPEGVWTLPPTYRLGEKGQGKIHRHRRKRQDDYEVRQTVMNDEQGTDLNLSPVLEHLTAGTAVPVYRGLRMFPYRQFLRSCKNACHNGSPRQVSVARE